MVQLNGGLGVGDAWGLRPVRGVKRLPKSRSSGRQTLALTAPRLCWLPVITWNTSCLQAPPAHDHKSGGKAVGFSQCSILLYDHTINMIYCIDWISILASLGKT